MPHQATPPSAKLAKAPEMKVWSAATASYTPAPTAGIDVKVVSERLGHSGVVITWSTYQHVVKGMQADAAERVSDLISGAGNWLRGWGCPAAHRWPGPFRVVARDGEAPWTGGRARCSPTRCALLPPA